METLVKETVEQVGERDVTLFDKCDAHETAHVQAFGAAFKGDMALFFCGHHLHKHRAQLIAEGWEILDVTDRINLKPTPEEDE